LPAGGHSSADWGPSLHKWRGARCAGTLSGILAHVGGVWQQLEHQHDDQPYVRIDPVQRAVDSVYVAIRGLDNGRIH